MPILSYLQAGAETKVYNKDPQWFELLPGETGVFSWDAGHFCGGILMCHAESTNNYFNIQAWGSQNSIGAVMQHVPSNESNKGYWVLSISNAERKISCKNTMTGTKKVHFGILPLIGGEYIHSHKE